MRTLVSDIVSDVINELSQVPGVATQIYSAGRIQQFVQSAFLLEFEEMWWPDYMSYFTVTTDGTTGAITSDLVGPLGSVSEYGDIAFVWPANSNSRLRELPPGRNPMSMSNATDAGIPYIMPDYSVPNRPLKIFPPGVVGSFTIWARQRPKMPLALADYVMLDRLLLTYGAAWMYSTDDGTVPAQVTKYEMLAVKRRKQCLQRYTQQPVPLDARVMDQIEDGGWFTVGVDPLA